MKYALALVSGFAVGVVILSKAYPAIRAKLDALDLDDVWEIWDDEELM